MNMLIVNIVFALLVLGFIGAGLKDGFIQTFGRLVGAIIGFLAARAWSVKVSAILALFMPLAIANVISFVIIFVAATQLLGIAFKLVDGIFKILSFIPFLKSINSLLGAIIGLGEGIVMIGGLIYLVKTFFLEPHLIAWISSSIVAQWIEFAFTFALGFLL